MHRPPSPFIVLVLIGMRGPHLFLYYKYLYIRPSRVTHVPGWPTLPRILTHKIRTYFDIYIRFPTLRWSGTSQALTLPRPIFGDTGPPRIKLRWQTDAIDHMIDYISQVAQGKSSFLIPKTNRSGY